MILTIASLKGGSGKSTLAGCIALHRKALAIDGDPQGSLANWRGLEVVRDVSEGIGRTAEGLRSGKQWVVVDSAGLKTGQALLPSLRPTSC